MSDVGLVALLVAAFLLVIGLVRLVDTLISADLPDTEADEQFDDDWAGRPGAGPGNDNPLEPM
jgi:hypothetical protein